MASKTGRWGVALSKLRKTQLPPAPQPTREKETPDELFQDKLVYPRFQRPVSDDSPVYSELMFPPTPLPTVPMASDSNLNPLAMASTISQARLNALHSGKDLELFFQRGKDCIDAYAQATKAMMEDACARVKDGEDPPYEEIEQLKWRFFRYCQTIVEEALSLIAGGATNHPRQASNSTMPSMVSSASTKTGSEPKTPLEISSFDDRLEFSGALLDSSGQGRLRLYTVSSDEWVMVPSMPSPTSPANVVAPELMDPVEESIHFGVIVRIFGKLYTISKMMETITQYYGAEPDNSKTGLPCWIKRSEQNVRTQKMAVLIDTVENLYYALYARITIELASIELCGSFRIDTSALRVELPYLMPEADHLYRIVLAFKNVLNSPEICAIRRMDVIAHFQQGYINQLAKKKQSKDELLSFDPLAYRPFALRTVSYRHGSYCEKWKEFIPFFDSIPAETMATLSEKYLTMTPVIMPPDNIPFVELPWIHSGQVGKAALEKEVQNDYLLLHAAQTQDTTIGEERKKGINPDLYHFARKRKCICKSICGCSWECTQEVQRPCPCAERHVRIMLTKRLLAHRWDGPAFAITASTTARMFFDGLAQLRRDVDATDIANELDRAFELFSLLISKERGITYREDFPASF
ncbi:actin-related protein 2/3 complex subunit 2 [Penicillium digitatum]|uniref:Uncharacterized protein n=3 Tax=Penicillium digitatum TaxID=36651 RepID=K9GD23_PEND2|nr:hypothetical protein PDIP_10470 [Penicillium digitatum Pd1]EKV19082.1 hypothetical protein PDIG_05790 [Penicillium digitatum PHI26]EKV20991.1 hypothetical protein PDIP_10470 [Penicillium digitatum Pd1]QQK48317.1 actin-related protein 2/3 complex subunit 2 [Penicillium digitatum]